MSPSAPCAQRTRGYAQPKPGLKKPSLAPRSSGGCSRRSWLAVSCAWFAWPTGLSRRRHQRNNTAMPPRSTNRPRRRTNRPRRSIWPPRCAPSQCCRSVRSSHRRHQMARCGLGFSCSWSSRRSAAPPLRKARVCSRARLLTAPCRLSQVPQLQRMPQQLFLGPRGRR